jgi:hypothetical protein
VSTKEDLYRTRFSLVRLLRPFISDATSGAPVFAIQVITASEQKEVLTLLPLFTNHRLNDSRYNLAKWLVTSPDIGRALSHVMKFYSIASGNSIGVYHEWYVIFLWSMKNTHVVNRKNVEPIVNGTFTRFRKLSKLGVALAYIALKPTAADMESIYPDIFGHDIAEVITSATSFQGPETSGTCI